MYESEILPELKFDQQVANVCDASFFDIRAKCGLHLPTTLLKMVACSIVGSRLEARLLQLVLCRHRAVQWHYIDKLSNDTVPNHTFITTNHKVLFIYNRTNITG